MFWFLLITEKYPNNSHLSIMKLFSKKYLIISVVLILGLVFLNLFPNVSKTLENFIFKIFSPVQKLFIKTGNRITGFFQILLSIKDLGDENIQLKQKNIELETQLSELGEIKKENETLRSALNFSQKDAIIYEMASVIGKNIAGGQDWILVDKGAENGIEKNMTVVSEQFSLVGKVIETGENFSKIMLITDKNNVVAALIENKRSEGITREENGSDKIFLDFIPKNENVELGEKIITSGMDSIYLKGILIGKVENIDLSENQLFQKISILPTVDFNKLETVFILKSR